MRIFDCFPLGYETDVLLLRLQTLADVVDEFCIVEGDRTFTGVRRLPLWPKLSTYPEFASFADRVHWMHVTLERDYDPWQREHELRGGMLQLADQAGCTSTDGVIIADADEISNPEAIRRWALGTRNPQKLPGYYHQLRLDLRAMGSLSPGGAGKPGFAWEHNQPIIGERRAFRHAQTDRAMMSARVRSCDPDVYGWHLTCQGSADDVVTKLRSFSHVELASMTADDVRQHIDDRITVGHNHPLELVALDRMPPPMQQNPERWKHRMIRGNA